MKLIVMSGLGKPIKEDHVVMKLFSDHSREEPYLAAQMFENGLETFHLRKANFSTKEMIAYLDKIPSKFHNRIVLHSHHNLAKIYMTKGVSLSKRDKKNNFRAWLKLKILKFKHPRLIVSTTYSKASALFEEKNRKYDYVFLSPVFDTLTGELISGAQQNMLKSVLERVPHKVIARGGISVEKVQQVKEMGFAGMAVHSMIWKKPDPVAEFVLFRNKFKELDIPIE